MGNRELRGTQEKSSMQASYPISTSVRLPTYKLFECHHLGMTEFSVHCPFTEVTGHASFQTLIMV